MKVCAAETVRRQVSRAFARSAEREEHVIRTRFVTYVDIPARKVETMRPVWQVVDELVAVQPSDEALAAHLGVRGGRRPGEESR